MSINANAEKVSCYACLKDFDIEIGYKISRIEECPHCKKDMHCCKMCQFFDKSAYNECRESMAQRVVDKEKSNFCEYFTLERNVKQRELQKTKYLDAANALFKK